jgi:hypothetical protein
MVKLLQKLVPAIRGLTALPHIRFVVSTLLLMAGCIYVWIQIPQGLYAGTDGRLYKGLIAMQQEFSTPFTLNGMNVLQGMGNQFLPMNIWLHPSYLPFHFFPEETAVLLSTTISWLALVLATYCLSRCWGLSETSGIVAAHACTLLFYPFQYEFNLGINYLLNPGAALMAAVVITCLTLLASATSRFSEGKVVITKCVLLLMSILFGLLIDPIWFVTGLIFLIPFFIIPVLASPRKTKIALLAIFITSALIFLKLSNIPEQILSLFSFTARTFFPDEVVGHSPTPSYISSFLNQKNITNPLLIFIGLFASISSYNKNLKYLSVVCFVYLAGLFALGSIFIISDTWTYPLPEYAEHAALPLFFISTISGYQVIWSKGCQIAKEIQIRISFISKKSKYQNINSNIKNILKYISWNKCIIMLGPALVAVYTLSTIHSRLDIYLESKDTVEPRNLRAILPLIDHIKLRTSDSFNGYAAIVDNRGIIATSRLAKFGNFLLKNKIPTINEYSQLQSPFTHIIYSRLCAGEFFGSANNTPIYTVNEKLFNMLGVVYIIANTHLNLTTYENIFKSLENEPVYLYKAKQPFSLLTPTKWIYISSLQELINEFTSSSFNPLENVLVTAQLQNNLIPAFDQSLEIIRGGYRVKATSQGTSLLILPIYFSNNLFVYANSGKGVKIFRANGILTGVEFSGEVDFNLARDTKGNWISGSARDLAEIKELKKGLVPRPVTIVQKMSALSLQQAIRFMKTFYSEAPIIKKVVGLMSSKKPIIKYQFNSNNMSCKSFAANAKRYVGNPFLIGYGESPPWLQEKNCTQQVISMNGSFLGVGWGEIGQLSAGPVRRLDYRHDEGIVLFRVDPQKSYRVKLRYAMHMPQYVANDLTVGFNGVRAEVAETGQEGEFAWTEYLLPQSIAGSCNGWVELLISTRGKIDRPASVRNQPWTGFYLLLNSITIFPEI